MECPEKFGPRRPTHAGSSCNNAKEGRRVLPYFMEWRPTRLNDERGFLEGLVTIGGERAANEYIEEAARAFGEAHVKASRRHLVGYLENKSV